MMMWMSGGAVPPIVRIDQSKEVIAGVTGARGPARGHCGDGVMATGNIHRELDSAGEDQRIDGYDVESAILQHLEKRESCTLEELTCMLAICTLNQVCLGVARLSRKGRIVLRYPSRFDNLVSAVVPDIHNQSRTGRE